MLDMLASRSWGPPGRRKDGGPGGPDVIQSLVSFPLLDAQDMLHLSSPEGTDHSPPLRQAVSESNSSYRTSPAGWAKTGHNIALLPGDAFTVATSGP